MTHHITNYVSEKDAWRGELLLKALEGLQLEGQLMLLGTVAQKLAEKSGAVFQWRWKLGDKKGEEGA